jgi:hypothetical protein
MCERRSSHFPNEPVRATACAKDQFRPIASEGRHDLVGMAVLKALFSIQFDLRLSKRVPLLLHAASFLQNRRPFHFGFTSSGCFARRCSWNASRASSVLPLNLHRQWEHLVMIGAASLCWARCSARWPLLVQVLIGLESELVRPLWIGTAVRFRSAPYSASGEGLLWIDCPSAP